MNRPDCATWPMGLLGEQRRRADVAYRVEHLPPVQRGLLVSDVEAAGTPIILVHGIVDNRSVFALLRRGLRRRAWQEVSSAAKLGKLPRAIATIVAYKP